MLNETITIQETCFLRIIADIAKAAEEWVIDDPSDLSPWLLTMMTCGWTVILPLILPQHLVVSPSVQKLKLKYSNSELSVKTGQDAYTQLYKPTREKLGYEKIILARPHHQLQADHIDVCLHSRHRWHSLPFNSCPRFF